MYVFYKKKMKNIVINIVVVWEKVSIMIKKINCELMIKKYLKAEKRFNSKLNFLKI